MLECVVNISEGCDPGAIAAISRAAGACLLDIHSDCDHHRSVLTLAGPDDEVQAGARDVARLSVALLDLRNHTGAHPRTGVLDVVPWVALEGRPLRDTTPDGAGERALSARDGFARWAGAELDLPVFLYGPERSLPEVRRLAWGALAPDFGPRCPHPSAGAVAVGCRPLLVAYNLWLRSHDLAQAKAVATAIRGPAVRALGLPVSGGVQVSCNLVRPLAVGPAELWDKVAELAAIDHAELVGLMPEAALKAIPRERWAQLDLSAERTLEARVAARG
jgi:glutamate formiminotransferase